MSLPLVPTLASPMTVVPLDSKILVNVAVPVAGAFDSWVIALALATPLVAAGNAVALKVSVARRVLPESAVSGVDGLVPE